MSDTVFSVDESIMVTSFLEVVVGHSVDTAYQFLQAANWRLKDALDLFYAGNAGTLRVPLSRDAPPGCTTLSSDHNASGVEEVGRNTYARHSGGYDALPCLPVTTEAVHDGATDQLTLPWFSSCTSFIVTMQTSYSADDDPFPSVHDTKQDDVGTASSPCDKLYNEWYEILSRMPAKSAIRYSSFLCKWLGNILSDAHLIKKQCFHSFGQDHGFFLYQHPHRNDYDQLSNRFEFHVFPGETESAIGIPRESLEYLPEQGPIFSSSNGLLLLGLRTQQSFNLLLCNPATRKWTQLGAPEGFNLMVCRDFTPLIQCYPGAHGVNFPNDYTVVVPVEAEHPKPQLQTEHLNYRRLEDVNKQLLIYSNGRWEEELCDINIDGQVVSYKMPVAVFSDATNGLLVHYLCHSNTQRGYSANPIYVEPYVAVFDIREKKLAREIKIPEEVWCREDDRRGQGGSYEHLWIFKWNETSICLLKWRFGGAAIGVWALDNYGGEGESWRMIMDRYTNTFGNDYRVEMLMDVRVVSGGRLLIATKEQLYMYVMEEERLEVVLDHSVTFARGDFRYVTFTPYANTLRPVSVTNSDTHAY